MGARGVLPQTAEIHYLKGNDRKHPPKHTVKARPGIPTPPARIKGEALAEWKRITPELDRLGLLSTIDRAVLVQYCQWWARWCHFDAILTKDGYVHTDHRHVDRKHPNWLMFKDADVRLEALAKQLGLTPNARLRMTPTGKDGDGDPDLLS